MTQQNFSMFQERNIQNPSMTELSSISGNGVFPYISENVTFKSKLK